MKSLKNKIFSWLFRIHIYGGLYCSFYFIVIGISAIEFQHEIFNRPNKHLRDYHSTLHLPDSIPQDSIAIALSDSLNIFGNHPWWYDKTDSAGVYSFRINRPGRSYDITYDKQKSFLQVSENATGWISVITGLHIYSDGELSHPLFKIWRFYAESSVIVALLLIITSIYFWFKKSLHKRSEWIAVAISTGFCLFYILHIWLVG